MSLLVPQSVGDLVTEGNGGEEKSFSTLFKRKKTHRTATPLKFIN